MDTSQPSEYLRGIIWDKFDQWWTVSGHWTVCDRDRPNVQQFFYQLMKWRISGNMQYTSQNSSEGSLWYIMYEKKKSIYLYTVHWDSSSLPIVWRRKTIHILRYCTFIYHIVQNIKRIVWNYIININHVCSSFLLDLCYM